MISKRIPYLTIAFKRNYYFKITKLMDATIERFILYDNKEVEDTFVVFPVIAKEELKLIWHMK